MEKLGKPLVVVISESGSTSEPHNAMLEVMATYKNIYSFFRYAIAITGPNNPLNNQARSENQIVRFPLRDWVGGRTSLFSAVGLLPAALQGIFIKAFIIYAHDMDNITRTFSARNPAMMMALASYYATSGKGTTDMVVIPYNDILSNFAKHLQQLLM
jgi:glucose-6-phosphate isomerase